MACRCGHLERAEWDEAAHKENWNRACFDDTWSNPCGGSRIRRTRGRYSVSVWSQPTPDAKRRRRTGTARDFIDAMHLEGKLMGEVRG
jgi:hypothetical protein